MRLQKKVNRVAYNTEKIHRGISFDEPTNYALCIGDPSECWWPLFLRLRCLPNEDLPNDVLLPPSKSRVISFSVGDPRVRLDRLEDRFMFELTLSIDGYCCISPLSPSGSSMGRHVSTIASKQFTNSSLLSAVLLYWKDWWVN